MANDATALFQTREKRVNDAVELKVPDRVPIMVISGFYPAFHYGITCQEAMYEPDKAIAAWSRFVLDFEPDMIDSPFATRVIGGPLEALDYRQLKWAGHGVGVNDSYQFVEGEYMKPEEYDELLSDPSDFLMRRYWPRISGALKPLEKLPPFRDLISYYMGIGKLAALDAPDVRSAFDALLRAAAAASRMADGARRWALQSRELGFPAQAGALSQAPFDTLSDFLRGTQGAMVDMFRRPDKLLAALEKLYPVMLEAGLAAKARGVPRVFMPLHKGLDGFMSPAQFEKFYWPTLKRLIEDLIAGGCTPNVLWEGDVTSRLETIADIPRGKAIYGFERTDMFRAKEVLGGVVCLKGNVPLSMLMTETPDAVKAYCRKLIDVVGKDGGFIMDASAVVDDARPENLRAMFEFTKEYGVYR